MTTKQTDLINTWAYEVDRLIPLGAKLLPKHSPRIPFTASPESTNSGKANGADRLFDSVGHGLVNLSQEAKPHIENQSRNDKLTWAISLTGLELVDEGYRGGYQYFSSVTHQGQPIGALALDLAKMKLKSIPVGEVHRYRGDIPPVFQSVVGHVHLPWGVKEETVYAQAIIKHPHQPTMKRDDYLQLLTTSFQCQFAGDNPNTTFL